MTKLRHLNADFFAKSQSNSLLDVYQIRKVAPPRQVGVA